MNIDEVLEAMPALLESEPDASKRQKLSEMTARLEEVKHRKLLCDVHGIQVFEYQGKRSLVLSETMAARMQNLELQISDSLREMIEDLSGLAAVGTHFKADEVPRPPDPHYDGDFLVNGEAFHKSAAELWAKSAPQRGLWEFVRTRIGPKLNKLKSGAARERKKHAETLKREIAQAIDLISDTRGRSVHGATKLVLLEMPDHTRRPVTLAWAALKMTCALIFINLKAPNKGEVRKMIASKWPDLSLTRSGWSKVWRTAGLGWLDRQGEW